MTLSESSINPVIMWCGLGRLQLQGASQHRHRRGVDINQMVVHASHLQGPAHSTRGTDLQRHLHFLDLQPIAITPTLDG